MQTYFVMFQYASWDLAFHMIPMANIDLHFAKEQLMLFLREWYMHPNGQVRRGPVSLERLEWDVNDDNSSIAVFIRRSDPHHTKKETVQGAQ